MDKYGQVYIADDDTPQSEIQRYKSAVREHEIRVQVERNILEANPGIGARELRRKLERELKKNAKTK